MINVYDSILHIQILQCQSAKFRDTHPCMKKDINHFVILTVHIIVMDEFQKLSHLFSGNCLPGHAVVYYYRGKFKAKWIFAKDIIIHCHLESGPQHTTDCLDCAVPPAVLLKFDQKQLCVRSLDLGNLLPIKWLLFHKILHKIVIRQGVRLYPGFRWQIPFYQFLHCHVFPSGIR